MKILVIGADGQLGQELIRQGRRLHPDILGVDYPIADITEPGRIAEVFSNFRPQVTINTAAYTNVDGAESEPELAMSINCDGPANIARLCAKYRIPAIHISTDYVFDGTKGSPYIETDPVTPTGVYGRSKAAGEQKLQSVLADHIILRTAWLYSYHGHNFVKTMLRLAAERTEISVVSDQVGCPTSAADLAGAILTITDRIGTGAPVEWGTYHYCGRGITSWYDFARTIVQIGRKYDDRLNARIRSIKTVDYPTPAVRPPYSALNCNRIRHIFGISTRPWRESLALTIGELYGPAPEGASG